MSRPKVGRPLLRHFAALPFLTVLSFSLLLAQEDEGKTFSREVRDVSNDFVVMDVSAHPDDEDGYSLAYYRMKYGAKTYSVLFTRGEGGQNETGPELYEKLGVLRSEETRAAGKILGAEVQFLNFLDFGYSKTATEAFHKWGGQNEVLRRLVYAIRKNKPDVLFTNHNTIDGHGHHQAVAVTLLAAFDAAADSNCFPEQLKESGIALWQPRKLFFRVFGRGEPIADVSNQIGEFDSSAGSTYLDIASRALRMHKTQGMDRADLRSFTRGKSLYKLMRSNSQYEQDSTTFLSGIDPFRDPSVAPLAPLRKELDLLRPAMPGDSIVGIVCDVIDRTDSLLAGTPLSPLARRMIDHWREEGSRLVATITGVKVDFRLRDTTVVAQQRVACDLTVTSSRLAVSNVRWGFSVPEGWSMQEESGDAPLMSPHFDQRVFTLTVGGNAQLTLPKAVTQYRSLEKRERIFGRVSMMIGGRRLRLGVEPSYEVAPRQEIDVEPQTVSLLRSRLREGFAITYLVRNHMPHKTAGRVGIKAPAGWSGENAQFVIDQEDSTDQGRLVVTPPPDAAPGAYPIDVRTELASTRVTVNIIDAACSPGINIGIIKSYDTTMEEAAATLGVRYHVLSDEDIVSEDLSHYSTIVIDIRAYLVRDALRAQNGRLLDYVRNGGNLVVMYQKDQEWKPAYAPYPFRISRQRACVEESPITILLPAHPLMQSPNRIGAQDWMDWTQERALYMPADVPEAYERILSCADPDESPLTTGYLAAWYGSGTYIYTTYVWYRQLKEGNAGAYRCFANMLSYSACRKKVP